MIPAKSVAIATTPCADRETSARFVVNRFEQVAYTSATDIKFRQSRDFWRILQHCEMGNFPQFSSYIWGNWSNLHENLITDISLERKCFRCWSHSDSRPWLRSVLSKCSCYSLLRGDLLVRALNWRSKGRWFQSWPCHVYVTNLDKLFTHTRTLSNIIIRYLPNGGEVLPLIKKLRAMTTTTYGSVTCNWLERGISAFSAVTHRWLWYSVVEKCAGDGRTTQHAVGDARD